MSDNPLAPPLSNNDAPIETTNKPRKRITFLEILVVIGIIVVLIGLFLPAVQNSGPAPRQAQCMNNLRQIGLALSNYESRYNSPTPAYTIDSEGRPLHSWRSLLLPYLEEQALYDLIDFSKPWDAPENEAARNAAANVAVFSCPSVAGQGPPMTTYLAVIDEQKGSRPVKLRMLMDRGNVSENRLIVLDAPESLEVHWMSPKDLSSDELSKIDTKTNSPHHNVYFGLFADGTIRTSPTLSKDDWD